MNLLMYSIKNTKNCLALLGLGAFVLCGTGCVADVSISSSTSNLKGSVSFNSVSPYVQTSNVSSYAISGTCNPLQNLTLKARLVGQTSTTSLAGIVCSKDGTFSVNQDLSVVSDGSVELSLHDTTTDVAITNVVVAKDTIPPSTTLLSPPPAVNSLTSIVSGVSPADTISYSYKLSTLGAVDCALESGYSAFISVIVGINENIAMLADGSITLCLRGQDAAGNKQTTATVYTWTKDTATVTAILAGLPASVTKVAAQTATVGGAGVINYKYKFGLSSLIDCSNSSGYSAATPVATAINVTASSGDGTYKICVIGADAQNSWQALTNVTSVSWDYDSTAPTLAISAPSANSYVSPANQASYSITTSCSESGRAVQTTATSSVDSSQVTGSGTCAGGSVTITLNLSSLPEGGIGLSSAQTDAAGNTGTSSAVTVTRDVTAPSLTGPLAHAAYGNSLSATPNLSWSAATDASGIQKYQVAVGTTSGGTQTLTWTDIGNVTSYSVSGLSLSEGTLAYYPQIRAVDLAGNVSAAIVGSDFRVDTTAPDVSAVTLTVPTESWSKASSPALTWNAATDANSGVSDYQIAIGTAAGLANVQTWTSVGNVTSATMSGLNLTRGILYYASLRVVDIAGNISAVISGSNAWLVNPEIWGADGEVTQIIKSGRTLYLAGYFSHISPWLGGGVPVSPADGSVSWPNATSPAKVLGSVYSSVADGNGGFYIGGFFTKVGSVVRGNLAHILSDGSVDANFNVSTDDSVNTLLLVGSTLYLGGQFNTVGGLTRNYLAAVDVTSNTVVSGFVANANAPVEALTYANAVLYVGGSFTTIGGAAIKYVAALLGTTGSVLATFNPNANDQVNALAFSGSSLYVGGNFTNIGGAAKSFLAALDVNSATGTAVPGFSPAPDQAINTLLISGTTLYVGGAFSNIGGAARNRIAAIDSTTGTALAGFNPNADNSINALVLSGSTLYVLGNFQNIAGVARKYAAAFSTTDGSLIAGFDPSPALPPFTASLSGGRLFLGGEFGSVGGTVRNNLAAISLLDGSVVSSFDPNPDSYVYNMLLSGSTLYIAGNFTHIGGAARNHIAAIDVNTGAALAGFDPNADGPVQTLLLSGSTLYAGGYFGNIGGLSRNNIAALDTATGLALPGFNPNADSGVASLALSGSTLYMAGAFLNVGGVPRSFMAAVSTVDGSVLPGFHPDPDGMVVFLFLSGSTLYASGQFTTIAGGTIAHLAALDSVTGALNTGFNANLSSTFDFLTSVDSMVVSGSKLYISGYFEHAGATAVGNVITISATDGSLLANLLPPLSSYGYVDSLVLSGNVLYLGGYFPVFNRSMFVAPLDATTGAWLPGD